MSRTTPPRQRAGRRTQRGAAVLAVGTALSLAVPAAGLAHAQSGTPGSAPAATAAPALTGLAKEINDARGKARAGGKPVVVESLTTESSQTVANPDGTLTSDSAAQPVRTKHGKSWVDIDSTLRKNADGTFSPVNTPAQVTFSAGGTGALATATTADGKKLSITAPFKLPAPTIDADSATYSSVLPDVDLRVTALPTGGWREVIVVKTAAAAADPALKTLHFPLTTTGLTVATDQAGNVTLKDAAGKVRMHAPTPVQWDSALPTPAAGTGTGRQSRLASSMDSPEPAVGHASSPDGPGDNAAVGTIKVAASADAIDLTPDQSKLGQGTGPWYLDPTVSADGGAQVTAQVQENHPDTGNVNTLSDLGTGYCGYSDCTGYGRYRAYYQLAIPGQLTARDASHGNPVVHDATLESTITGSSSPSTSTPMDLYWTGGIDGSTTWNHQPCGGGMSGCTKVTTTWHTGTGNVYFDVTSQMQQAVNSQWGNWTVALVPDDEMNKYYRQHFSSNVHIVTNYDIAPTIWYPRTTPTPGFAGSRSYNDCQTPGGGYAWYNPGWVGANQNITLTASTWSPIGAGVNMNFHMWDDNDSGFTFNQWTGTGGSYQSMPMNVGSLTDGHQYGWTANANDGWLSSGDSTWCYFRVDKTPPTLSMTSTDFPPTGMLNATPKLKAGQTGSFQVHGTDPAPAGGNASGLACFRFTDNPTPVTGWHCGDAGTSNADGSGNASFSYRVPYWGTNVVFAQAQDNAGNYSQPVTYSFYAPWDPATATPVPGNLTGDGRPDILLPDAQGNLRMLPIGVDPTTAQAAPLGLAPQDPTSGKTTTWNDVQTTHRGALRSWGVDDVFARTTLTPTLAQNLYLYPNKGNGTFGTYSSVVKPTSWVDTSGNPIANQPADFVTDWSKTTQIVALGTIGTKISPYDTDITTKQTSLLAVENGNLWLYRSTAIDVLDADAIEVSNTGDQGAAGVNAANWENFDLIGPGPASATGLPTLWTRSKADGTIHAYPIKLTNGKVDLSALADPRNGYIQGTGGVSPSNYPTVSSVGDINGDGVADLWALDSSHKMVFWAGQSTDGTANTPMNSFGNNYTLGYPDGSVTLYTSVNNAASCADAGGSGNGSPIQIWGCWNGSNQHYHFYADGTIRNQGRCVAASGGGTGNNTAIILWDCLGGGNTSQQWVLRPDGSILNPVSGRCLDVPGGVSDNGTHLQLYDCNGSPAQKWLPVFNTTT